MSDWFLDQARLGNVYHSHNTTAGAVTVLSATCTGLVIENPYGSNQDLVIKSMLFVGSTLTTIREVGIAVNAASSTAVSTNTTAAVIHNGRNTGSDVNVGVGLSYSIATLPAAPVWIRPIGSARVTVAVEGLKALVAKFDGTLVVPPGGLVCFSTLTAAATGLCSATWAEVDILG